MLAEDTESFSKQIFMEEEKQNEGTPHHHTVGESDIAKERQKGGHRSSMPKLPKLPALPRLPGLEEKDLFSQKPGKLPSYPSNSLGEKFSQDTIKEAVTGEKEEGFGEDEFAPLEEERRIPRPLIEPLSREFGQEEHGTEPIFIRIDKFEESLATFEKMKKQISQIENVLGDIKKIKDDEDRELENWEKEIQSVKKQIEKIDKDIFSRV